MAYCEVKQTDNGKIIELVVDPIGEKLDALEVSVSLANNAAHGCAAEFSQERMIEWLEEIQDAMHDLRDVIDSYCNYCNGKDS